MTNIGNLFIYSKPLSITDIITYKTLIEQDRVTATANANESARLLADPKQC